MKLCQRHISDLIGAIRRKGMGHLISVNDAQASARCAKWLDGKTTADEFDPLVVSMLEINHKASLVTNLSVTAPCCPLCEVERRMQRYVASSWIDNVTDMMILICETNAVPVAA